VDARVDRDATNGIDRRQVLARALGGAALFLVAACGKDSGGGTGTTSSSTVAKKKGTGKGQRPHDPLESRPAGAKTTKRRHAPPQASALRSKEPLPSDLQRYVLAKRDDGTLVARGKRGILHHPVLCKGHLGTTPPAPSGGAAAPRLHGRYADGILYALVRAEADVEVALGLTLLAATTWPVSARFADFAIGALEKAGRPRDEPTLSAALASAATRGGGAAPSADALRARAREALRVLEARVQTRGTQRRR
jgi:hypothetical protein